MLSKKLLKQHLLYWKSYTLKAPLKSTPKAYDSYKPSLNCTKSLISQKSYYG